MKMVVRATWKRPDEYQETDSVGEVYLVADDMPDELVVNDSTYVLKKE